MKKYTFFLNSKQYSCGLFENNKEALAIVPMVKKEVETGIYKPEFDKNGNLIPEKKSKNKEMVMAYGYFQAEKFLVEIDGKIIDQDEFLKGV